MRENQCMAGHEERATGKDAAPVTGLVPMLPVTDVERSIEFYKLLGFAVGNREPRDGLMNWAWLYAPKAPDWRRGPNLMLSRAERAVDPAAGGVLFYLYVTDLVTLRSELLKAGQNPGPIKYPEYLPNGELAVQDPDGYRLMLAQTASDTP
jgi:catechol 2,3-dioxygenase-like lactoylglutathione lyase family enzyme